MSSLRHILGNNAINVLGWRSKRRIVVIESDDWGSIRVPQHPDFSKYQKEVLGGDIFDQIDSFATVDDFSALYEVLLKYVDSQGRHPVITANTIVANPDFKKIKESNFHKYYYEPFTSTLKRFKGCENSFKLWQEGIAEGIFYPQFHGREHLNIPMWLNSLRMNHFGIRKTFDMGGWQSRIKPNEDSRIFIVRGLNYKDESDLTFMKDSIRDGLDIFYQILGYRSESFMAPCYCWGDEIEEVLHNNGVNIIQSALTQVIPVYEQEKRKVKYHYTGETNKRHQIYTIRNVTFEPSVMHKSDWVDYTMSEINTAFIWKKPAIISMHRINCVGAIERQNRDTNLRLLDRLLQQVINKFPDVEFMTSNELGRLIFKDNYYEKA